MDINILLLFLLLLLFGSQANHFFGTVMTFTPKDKTHNGSVTVGVPIPLMPGLFSLVWNRGSEFYLLIKEDWSKGKFTDIPKGSEKHWLYLNSAWTLYNNTTGVIVTILQVAFHYKLSFRSCTDQDTWSCVSGDCGTESVELSIVDEEDKEWCQREGVMSREVSSNAVFQLRSVTRQIKKERFNPLRSKLS